MARVSQWRSRWAASLRALPKSSVAAATYAHRPALLRPTLLLSLARILVIWLAAWSLFAHERDGLINENRSDATALSLLFEQDVGHIVEDIDRILRFLRHAAAQQGPAVDWASLVTEDYTIGDVTVQVSAIGADGLLIASSEMPHPSVAVDLSDREHFKVHLRANEDRLFISDLILGRVSGKQTIQFTRRVTDSAGQFAGVVVASLDPALLARKYHDLNLDRGGGFALVGEDGRLRIGLGSLAGASALTPTALGRRGAAELVSLAEKAGEEAVMRDVEGLPLNVLVAVPSVASDPRLDWWFKISFGGAALLTIIVWLTGVAVVRGELRYEAGIAEIARKDPLTNLPNRLLLGESLERIWMSSIERRAFALHIIDLDRFKFVNDTFGHAVGDELLRDVAGRLTQVVPTGGAVVRLGGDEFAVIQPVEIYERDAATLAARICSRLSEPYKLGDIHINIGATVGIASAAHDGATTSHLLKCADMALYAAKADGRGDFRFFEPEMQFRAQHRAMIESGLRRAIERCELTIAYQPIKRVRGEKTVGLEALARWRTADGTDIPPAEFIPVAEESGLIVAIGAWILERACMDIARSSDSLRVAVNCSPVQLESSDIAALAQLCLEKSNLPASRLEIEITESLLINDSPRVMDQIRRLKAMGVRISLDDFGTGYSSLNCLDLYPFDSVKIDRSFIQKLAKREQTRSTVRAIVELASSFGMTTIAEGIETEAQLRMIADLGCHEAQGYLFSEPRPLEEMLLLTALEGRPAVAGRGARPARSVGA